MTREPELARALSGAFPDTPDHMSELHERMVSTAKAERGVELANEVGTVMQGIHQGAQRVVDSIGQFAHTIHQNQHRQATLPD